MRRGPELGGRSGTRRIKRLRGRARRIEDGCGGKVSYPHHSLLLIVQPYSVSTSYTLSGVSGICVAVVWPLAQLQAANTTPIAAMPFRCLMMPSSFK